MAYLHIENLYRPEAQTLLMLKECYVTEKVHGTSAHISFRSDKSFTVGGQGKDFIQFFSGGEKHERFVDLFNHEDLLQKFQALGHHEIIVFGEAYGGSQQGMSHTYGDKLQFIAFEVKISDYWLDVPKAADVVEKLGLEFVPWKKVSTDLEVLDKERDAPSEVAKRRGITEDKHREGIVIRPLIELTHNGHRMIAKHKGAAFAERKNPPKVIDPSKLKVLSEAKAIADEWITDMRLEHVVDRLKVEQGGLPFGIQDTGTIIKAMVEDVKREAEGEIVLSSDAIKVISTKTAKMWKERICRIYNS